MNDIGGWFKNDRPVYAWVPVFLWAGIVLFFSVLPYGNIEPVMPHFDKILHFFEFFFFSYLLMKGFYRTTEMTLPRNALFTLIIGGGYGILMELVQQLVPGRYLSAGDLGADLAGIVFGIVVGKVLIWQR
ncbi:MAG: hypothetical protein GF408_03550 [Candidatus Omnitrophica bacterium]|nr:hypothetical protein [Candidatus Omnitrophota bacterium]